jgi:hypothetical protein
MVEAMMSVRVKESKRPRAGRRFLPVAEKELRSDAVRAARGLPGAHRGLSVFEEVAGPFGIPDFLAAVGPRSLLRRRAALRVPPLLNEVDAGIVARASVRLGKSAEALAEQLGWGVETVERRLTGLLRSGALTDLGAGRYVRPAALAPIGRLYAVETKIRDFRRALRQARTYALWCDNYVIVMPALSDASLGDAVHAVARDRGGLVVDGRWVQRPGGRRIPPAPRLWGSEHLVAATMRVASPALGAGESVEAERQLA